MNLQKKVKRWNKSTRLREKVQVWTRISRREVQELLKKTDEEWK